VVAYVEAVGRRLAHHAPGYGFDYRFRVVDADAPNAFALPGGHVYISRGAVALCNSEDELAGVLGHEVAHVSLRHAAAREGVTAGHPFLQLLQLPYLAAYSRELERTADRVGQGLAAVAGYDPAGITSFLRNLDALERSEVGVSRIPGFLATHPGSVGRAADTAQRAQGIAWTARPGVAGGREGHLERLRGLPVGESPAQGVFDGARFLHPGLGFTLRFPDGWALRNTPAAVGALAPDRRAQIFLEHGGSARAAIEAARQWAEQGLGHGLRVYEGSPVRLAGREAYRLRASAPVAGEPLGLLATFLPWRSGMLRLVGASASPARHDPVFLNVARSFRPLTPELLARVKETRLALAAARPGESLAELSRRSGNAWPLLRTAAANGLRADHRFLGSELVKIAESAPYRPASAAERAEGGG
jgi:predicted Zn-dependent protease